MCGIYGYVGRESAAPILLEGIKKLEYRGYDSVGMGTLSEKGFSVKKERGSVDEVHRNVNFLDLHGNMGIVHTRWATHGGVTQANAHPHLSCGNKVLVVHNGIIENYLELKKELEQKGCRFVSETDSEVIPHYMERKMAEGREVTEAIVDFLHEAKGTFAVLLMVEGDDKIYALRRDSPLVLGIGKGEYYLASDIYPFSQLTNKAIFFDNDEWAIVDAQGYLFLDAHGNMLGKEIKEFEWKEEKEDGKYEHFMIKEIMEEPKVVRRLLLSLEHEQRENFMKLVEMVRGAHKVAFVAAGTSYHATLLGAYFLHKCGIESQTIIASEFEHFAFLDEKSVVIAFSQSGETMDVIDALKYAQSKGAKIVGVVNVPYSTVQRMVDLSINILAGQEVCVAATKSFVNQVTLLMKLAEQFGFKSDVAELPEKIEQVLGQTGRIQEIAHSMKDQKDLYVIGRALGYPVAREIALKIKEISYIHAEGMMGGELKHGTIALIEEGTPVISLVVNGDTAMLSNTKEVEARGAKVVIIGTTHGDILVPTHNDGTFGVLAAVVGQLLTYYIAKEKGLPIDKPRNLAKSVTVR
jgi:glucosamine--fructose-6-phosphate aminotransferase (isomerizing)